MKPDQKQYWVEATLSGPLLRLYILDGRTGGHKHI
jgi:hypothetical protein